MMESIPESESRNKHTPLPWHYQSTPTTGIYAANGVYVAAPHGPAGAWKDVKVEYAANANFIARACNAHGELLAVCEALAERGAVIATTGLGKQLRNAIARAEGMMP